MNAKFWVRVVLFVGFLFFCVHVFRIRLDYRFDRQKEYISQLEYQTEILSYAIGIVPKEIKNDVFLTSIKKNYPNMDKYPSIVNILENKVIEESNEPLVWRPSSLMNSFVDGMAETAKTEKFYVPGEGGDK